MGCDGIIYGMSYILHQRFMNDMSLLVDLMRRVRRNTPRLPTWLLLQDANYPDRPNAFTEIWPEVRVTVLADKCEEFGYVINSAKKRLRAPHRTITSDGRFVASEPGETDNVCYFFNRIQVG